MISIDQSLSSFPVRRRSRVDRRMERERERKGEKGGGRFEKEGKKEGKGFAEDIEEI